MATVVLPLEALLRPVSEASPCGPELLNEVLAYEERATPRVGGGGFVGATRAVEEPKWSMLVEQGVALLAQTKDLKAAAVLTLCALKQHGAAGMRDGLALLAALLENGWDELHPRIEEDDPDGALARANILRNLAITFGDYGDTYQFIRHLRAAPLFHAPNLGPVPAGLFANCQGVGPTQADGMVLSAGQVEAILNDQAEGVVQEAMQAVGDSLASLEKIEAVFEARAGGKSPDMKALKKELSLIKTLLALGTAGRASASGKDSDVGDVAAGSPRTGGVHPVSTPSVMLTGGSIQSREQVNAALDAVCKYYELNEPSSPMPFLIRRARRLVGRNFMEVIMDLAPDAESQIRLLTGPDETVTN